MPISFDATVGASTATSYATVADADAYFALRPGSSDWTAISTPEKEAALAAATARLEQETWKGNKYAPGTQRLKFPRSNLYDDEGYLYSTAAIPRPIEEATFELALSFAVNPDSVGNLALNAFRSLTIGPIALETRDAAVASWKLPDAVARLIANLLAGYAGAQKLVRG